MKKENQTLFIDIGGVLMTNGWDHVLRKKAAEVFHFDFSDFEQRHREFYDLHETGKMSLDDYLEKTIFWKKREFTLNEFKKYMLDQTQLYPEMLALFTEIKATYRLKIAAVSNEGKELTHYRLQHGRLNLFIDNFFISCFLHVQKPDPDIYRMAFEIMQVQPVDILYVDDRPNLVAAAATLGIKGCVHTSQETTKKFLLENLN